VWSDPTLRWLVIKKTFNFWQTTTEIEKMPLPDGFKISEDNERDNELGDK
jgi:hypothetical protein